MNPEPLQQVCSSVLRQLAEPAARSLALGCFAAATLAVLRVKNVSLRLTAWKAVLCVSLAMPLLGWLVPALPLSMPIPQVFRNSYLAVGGGSELTWRSATRGALGAKPADVALFPSHTGAFLQDGESLVEPGARSASSKVALSGNELLNSAGAKRTRWSVSWPVICAVVYFVVALILLARFCVGIWMSRRLARSSVCIREARAMASFSRCAAACQFAMMPRLAESERISVPVTMGIWHPIILFPADWRDWDDQELHAVLAHELSHCARHDVLVQRFALLHRAIFWFSPLSWWLNLQIAELAEEASDEAVLASGADRAEYAGTLLTFFQALQANSGRVWWQGMSMAKSGTAERRVDRILAWKGTMSMNLKKSFVFAILAAAVPIVFVAAAVRPVPTTSPSPTSSQASPAPAPSPAPSAAPTLAPAPAPSVGVIAPAIPAPPSEGVKAPSMPPAPSRGVVAPAMQAPPAPPAPQQPSSEDASKSNIYVYGGKNSDTQKVRMESGSCDIVGSTEGGVIVVAGDTCTVADFDGEDGPSVQAKITQHAIEFKHDGKQYVIRDQGSVDRAKKLFAPIFALSEKQSELGKQQSALGEKQSELGRQVSEVRVKMPDLTAELKAVESKMRELRTNGGTTSELGELQSELGELQSRIGEIESRAGEQQGEIGEKQGELGEQQGKLGEMQGKLGEEQGEASKKAARELKKLLEDALAQGLAKPQ